MTEARLLSADGYFLVEALVEPLAEAAPFEVVPSVLLPPDFAADTFGAEALAAEVFGAAALETGALDTAALGAEALEAAVFAPEAFGADALLAPVALEAVALEPAVLEPVVAGLEVEAFAFGALVVFAADPVDDGLAAADLALVVLAGAVVDALAGALAAVDLAGALAAILGAAALPALLLADALAGALAAGDLAGALVAADFVAGCFVVAILLPPQMFAAPQTVPARKIPGNSTVLHHCLPQYYCNCNAASTTNAKFAKNFYICNPKLCGLRAT